MSYYYKDKNGVVHTNSSNSFNGAIKLYNSTVPFKNSITAFNNSGIYFQIFKDNEDYIHPYVDFDNNSPTEYYKLNDIDSLPFIGIKDGSTKLFGSLYYLALNKFNVYPGHFDTHDYGYPLWLLNGLYISNYKQYYIDIDGTDNPPIYFPQRHSFAKWYELYNNYKPIVSYVDRNKGGILNFCYNNGSAPNDYGELNYLKSDTYWNSNWGPYLYDETSIDKFIRANNRHINPTGSIYNFNTNLGISFEPVTSFNNVYKKVNCLPIVEDQNKFGFENESSCIYFPEGTTASTPSSQLNFNYFRLNINDIKQNNNKLKLKYYYAILIDGKYTQITGTAASDGIVSNVTGYEIDKEMITLNNIAGVTKNSIFSFNYCISNASLWPVYEVDSNDEPLFKLHNNLETSMITYKDGDNYYINGTNSIEHFDIHEIGYKNPSYIVDSFDPRQGEVHVFDNLYITKINDLAGEGSLSSIGTINNVNILISGGEYIKNNWNNTVAYLIGDLVQDGSYGWYICKEGNNNVGKAPHSYSDYWYQTGWPHQVTSGELWGKFGLGSYTGNWPSRWTNLKQYIIDHQYNNPFIIFYGTDNDKCFIERLDTSAYPKIYDNYYNKNYCFKSVLANSGYFDKSSNYVTTAENFNPTKKYNRGDVVNYNYNSYITKVNILKDETKNINTTLNIKGGAYNIYNASGYENLRNYKSTNLIGSAEYTIDLTNVTEQYIHIAYPASILFNQELFPDEKCHVYVTDLKMTYEGVE